MIENKVKKLIDRLCLEKSLSLDEYEELIEKRTPETGELLAKLADEKRRKVYGNHVFIRGLVEISNVCKNDCFYCGIRKSNKNCSRYRLGESEILSCCEEGYALGFRTFVLQGGEDAFFDDVFLCNLIRKVKEKYNDCAVTLSLGERSRESYEKLYRAGADRYLLRHETADEEHYKKLHPKEMSFENRMRCLFDLKEIGYAVGCGFMVGSPFQTAKTLAKDLKFIEEFKPHMCGIGPFIPQSETPFGKEKAGDAELTCYLLSILRLISPGILLPSTTALSTIDKKGCEMGILSGANVVMPNLSPINVRKKYALYDNKAIENSESAQNAELLRRKMESIGYEVVIDRGDKIDSI